MLRKPATSDQKVKPQKHPKGTIKDLAAAEKEGRHVKGGAVNLNPSKSNVN